MIELVDETDRIRNLPRDERGYPVPWFVQWQDGKPIFPVMDRDKWQKAILDKRCWVCGQSMGQWCAFVVGPMCGITRTSAEPPSHRECAWFSVKNCPFLKNPEMKRIDNEYTKKGESPGGIMIKRNPGVSLVWVTKSYRLFRDPSNNWLITMGDPQNIECWTKGRRATADEIHEAIEAGCPGLESIATEEGALVQFLEAKAKFILLVSQ